MLEPRHVALALASDACEPCDTNCDGSLNGFNAQPFRELLAGGAGPCAPCAGDVNQDGSINGLDIAGFVDCLQP